MAMNKNHNFSFCNLKKNYIKDNLETLILLNYVMEIQGTFFSTGTCAAYTSVKFSKFSVFS